MHEITSSKTPLYNIFKAFLLDFHSPVPIPQMLLTIKDNEINIVHPITDPNSPIIVAPWPYSPNAANHIIAVTIVIRYALPQPFVV